MLLLMVKPPTKSSERRRSVALSAIAVEALAKVIAFAALWSVGRREAEMSFAVSAVRSPEAVVAAAEAPETIARASEERLSVGVRSEVAEPGKPGSSAGGPMLVGERRFACCELRIAVACEASV